MRARNQEGYQTLDWVLRHADQGFFLVVAEEDLQAEILSVYRETPVGIYDYREHPGPYSFPALAPWLEEQTAVSAIFLANLQRAVQTEDDVNRLNLSRDRLARLEQPLIFLTTPYGDDLLATGAYDFYSFLKLRILFHPHQMDLVRKTATPPHTTEAAPQTPEDARQRLWETDALLEQARAALDQQNYPQAEALLLRVLSIRKQLLGPGHLALAAIYQALAHAYTEQARYPEAAEAFQCALSINEEVWGEDHPNTADCYAGLAGVYRREGKYALAEPCARKAAGIRARLQPGTPP